MESAGELIRRARERKEVKSRPEAQPHAPEPPQLPPFVPKNSSYSALMRSHDRVNTRHLGKG